MGLVVPVFVSALADSSSSSSISKHQKLLHDHVLQRLMQIGPKYPAAFKSIMQSSPALKQKLEAAIRAGQTASQSAKVSRVPARGNVRTQQAPSIKLKTDFSNFK